MRVACFVLMVFAAATIEAREFGGSSATIGNFVNNYMSKVWTHSAVSKTFYYSHLLQAACRRSRRNFLWGRRCKPLQEVQARIRSPRAMLKPHGRRCRPVCCCYERLSQARVSGDWLPPIKFSFRKINKSSMKIKFLKRHFKESDRDMKKCSTSFCDERRLLF